MIESQCPVCSIQGLPFLQAKDYNRRISTERFLYYKCPSCGLIYLLNVPEDLGKYYPADYYTIPNDRESLLANSAREQYKLEIVQQFINMGRILEIGPALGTFAFLAKQSGFDVDVIEMDKQCCHFIQNELGIRAIQSDVPMAALAGLSGYNVITLWQVIEHLPDPWSVLKVAVEKLLPGGILVISAPNPDAFQFRIFGRFWTHIDAPRHVELIPILLLKHYMDSLGLKAILITTKDSGSLGWNIFGWQVSLMNFFTNRIARFIMRILGLVLSIVISPIERRDGRGSAYTIVFQKE